MSDHKQIANNEQGQRGKNFWIHTHWSVDACSILNQFSDVSCQLLSVNSLVCVKEQKGCIRADVMTCRPDEGNFISDICKKQVSAVTLVILSKTRWKTSGYVRPEASIHERFWISFRFFNVKYSYKWQWSAWARPKGKILIHTYWSSETHSILTNFRFFSSQKSSVSSDGMREQDQEGKKWMRTVWSDDLWVRWVEFGSIFEDMPKCKYQQKHWLSWARPDGKHRDTYVLKRRCTRDFGSVFGFRCQKKLVNGNGLREEDQTENRGRRTRWRVKTSTDSGRDKVHAKRNHQLTGLVLLSNLKTRWKTSGYVRPEAHTRDFGSIFGFQCQK